MTACPFGEITLGSGLAAIFTRLLTIGIASSPIFLTLVLACDDGAQQQARDADAHCHREQMLPQITGHIQFLFCGADLSLQFDCSLMDLPPLLQGAEFEVLNRLCAHTRFLTSA